MTGVAPAIRPCRRPRRPAAVVTVRPRPGRPSEGLAAFAGTVLPCALGRGGIRAIKREGDGATPRASMSLCAALYRPDRIGRPVTALPLRAIRPDDGWCDATGDGRYNRPVRLPFAASHEQMRRADGLYDAVIVLDFNLRPRVAGGGSAIFLHCARPAASEGARDAATTGFATAALAPTAGCIAFPRPVLLRLLARLPARARLRIV